MSYDFSNVTKIVVPEGEVYKITNSSNGVVWRKPYVWEQYTINTVTRYKLTWATTTTTRTDTIADMISGFEAWSDCSVNLSGEFVGSGEQYGSDNETIYVLQGAYSTYPYIVKYFGDNVIWKVSSANIITNGSVITKLTVIYYQGTITSTEVNLRGTATGNVFISNSSTAYPTNGVQGGYWYYRTQVGYTG